jgi:hypothetical protein
VDKGQGRRKDSGTPYSPDFDGFWSAYPNRKGGKEKAWQLWCKKMKEGTLPPAHELFTAVGALKRSQGWQKDNGQYIPMITTFLSQGRWTDAEGLQKLASGLIGSDCPQCGGGGCIANEETGEWHECLCRTKEATKD